MAKRLADEFDQWNRLGADKAITKWETGTEARAAEAKKAAELSAFRSLAEGRQVLPVCF